MSVLVASASKHGATAEIAEAIGRTLEQAGLDVVVEDAAAVTTVDQYEAAVIGSGAYAGHWLKAARALVEHSSLAAAEIASEALRIASSIDIYTNDAIICESLQRSGED